MAPPDIAILVLAAGASRRMGGADKLLKPINNVPLLTWVLRQAVATKAPVYAAINANPARRAALPKSTIAIEIENPELGMGGSIAQALRKILSESAPKAVVILPADMPDITTDDICALWQSNKTTGDAIDTEHRIIRGAAPDGAAGHPVLFPAHYFDELCALTGDIGGRDILRANHEYVHLHRYHDQRALIDLDTPEDWAKYQQRAQSNIRTGIT